MKYAKWLVPAKKPNIPQELLRAGYTPLLAALLAARGYETAEAAAAFLSCGEETLCDPLLMRDMEKAAQRVRLAIERGERVAVYGDYDVDGITSSCLVASYLRERGLDCAIYIPDRISEGYGVNSAAIDAISASGAGLVITVDCGITAAEEARHAAALGLDLIITDHHECGDHTLPEAVAVVDPKRGDCEYPFKELAGVGVAFKLLCAIEGDAHAVLDRYADLIAVGTIADVMPLVGENRYIVMRGLAALAKAPRLGFDALMREAGVADKKISATTVGYNLAPRINAAGRLGRAEVAVRLLTTTRREEAESLAAELCRLNRERQDLEQSIWLEASALLRGGAPAAPIVLAEENWHQGVIGIAASRLSEAYSMPTVMICLDGEMGKGSCRSVGGFNLFDALSACSEHLVSFGGHALAAGLTIRREEIEAFRRALADFYAKNPGSGAAALDCELRIDDPGLLTMENINSLDRMEPFGTGNPRPIFYIGDAELLRITPIGGGRHLRINLRKAERILDCVLFSRTAEELGLREGDRVDAAFYPQINEFRGRRTVQLLLTDLRRTDVAELCRGVLEGARPDGWEAAELCPTRADFVHLWRRLERRGGRFEFSPRTLPRLMEADIHPGRIALCLQVMKGERLVEISRTGESYCVSITPREGKADLDESELLRWLRDCRNHFGKEGEDNGRKRK